MCPEIIFIPGTIWELLDTVNLFAVPAVSLTVVATLKEAPPAGAAVPVKLEPLAAVIVKVYKLLLPKAVPVGTPVPS